MHTALRQVPASRPAPGLISPIGPISPAGLGAIIRSIASAPGQWGHLVRFSAGHRWYCRLEESASYEVWLLSWLPGQQTGFHDHGDASGAFAVADGELLESTAQVGRREIRSRSLVTGAVRSFGPAYLHDVRNAGDRPAVSVHAYSPALSLMRRYEMAGSGLVQVGAESADDGW